MLDTISSVTIKRVQIFTYRVPIETPVCTSFGTMYDRPAVLLRIEDADGAYGYGEAWCNFPACGAEHRARLLETVISPLLLNETFTSPQEAFAKLTAKVHVLSLQADEPGPLAQAVAATDIALWDLFSRKAQMPLYEALGRKKEAKSIAVPSYASGINPTNTLSIVEKNRAEGHINFKVKVGFNLKNDINNIKEVFASANLGETLAIDANQIFDLPEAISFVEQIAEYPLQWLEEPLRCDTHFSQWNILKQYCKIPLAAGENIRSNEGFCTALREKALSVVQPDICKWGGLTATLPIAKAVLREGLRYCPHYLGGGIGLVASAHLLAAVGGDGLLEIDINPNPLREALAQPYPQISQGKFHIENTPGLGIEPDWNTLKSYVTFNCDLS